jgi:DNA-binding MarR family transcriptional regulator
MIDQALLQQAETITALLPQLMRQLFRLDENDPTTELPLAQLRVCSTLQAEPRTMSVLSRELGTTLSAMTQITDRLERAQLVERITGGEDRRVKLLRLTPHAESLLQARRDRRIKHVTLVLERLSAPIREQIIIALNDLLSAGQLNDGTVADALLISEILDKKGHR